MILLRTKKAPQSLHTSSEMKLSMAPQHSQSIMFAALLLLLLLLLPLLLPPELDDGGCFADIFFAVLLWGFGIDRL